MRLLQSFDYRIEKWKYESLFGIRKIALFYLSICLLAVYPAYGFGQLIGRTMLKSQNGPEVSSLVTQEPQYKIESTSILSYRNQKRGYYARINNRTSNNEAVGYWPWVYDYTITDAQGNVLEEGRESSFLLPNTVQYIVGPIRNESGLRFTIETNTQLSKPVRFDSFTSKLTEIPRVTVANTSRPEVVNDNTDLVRIRFSIRNDSIYFLRSVHCTFLIRNPDQQIIGIGSFGITNLSAGETRPVDLTYPNPDLGTNDYLEVLPVVNYLNEDSIVLK